MAPVLVAEGDGMYGTQQDAGSIITHQGIFVIADVSMTAKTTYMQADTRSRCLKVDKIILDDIII